MQSQGKDTEQGSFHTRTQMCIIIIRRVYMTWGGRVAKRVGEEQLSAITKTVSWSKEANFSVLILSSTG